MEKLKIFMIIMDESQFMPLIYDKVIRERKDDIVGVCIVPPVAPSKSFIKPYVKFFKRHYVLYGGRGFVVKVVQQMYYKILSTISPLIKSERMYSIKSVAKKYSVPIYFQKDINDPKFLETLRGLNPDIITFASPQIVRSDLLKVPKIGCVNVHSALLPKYRGVYPMFWALLNNEKEVGVSVHFMDEKIDTGEIISQQKIEVDDNDTFESLYMKAIKIIPNLLLKAFDNIETDAPLIKNDATGATYFSYPKKDDVKRFRSLGKKMM